MILKKNSEQSLIKFIDIKAIHQVINGGNNKLVSHKNDEI